MKTLTLIIVVLSCCTLYSLAQIQASSFDYEVPELRASSSSDPHLIVIIDSVKYELVGLSKVDTSDNSTSYVYNVDPKWIKGISHQNGFEFAEISLQYEDISNEKNVVTVVNLYKQYFDDFLEGKEVERPLTIKTYN